MITWRTVSAANQGAANSLASQGAQTILNSLNNLGNRLQEPSKKAEAAKKEAFDQALRTTSLEQAQQRIDNASAQNILNNEFRDDQLETQTASNQAKAIAALEAAELKNSRDNARAETKFQNSKDLAAFKATLRPEDKRSQPNINLDKIAEDHINFNEGDIDRRSKEDINSLVPHLKQLVSDREITSAQAAEAIQSSFKADAGKDFLGLPAIFGNDAETLSKSIGKDGKVNKKSTIAYLKSLGIIGASATPNQNIINSNARNTANSILNAAKARTTTNDILR